MKFTHLMYGAKTRCKKWLNPETWWTVSLAEVTCSKCLAAYKRDVLDKR